MWFLNAGPTSSEQSDGSGGRDSSGSGDDVQHDRSHVVVDESAPLAHDSSTSHACAGPCGLSVVCLICCLVWIVGVAAILLLWFLPAPVDGTTSDRQDRPIAAIIFVASLLTFVSAFNVVLYCVQLRRRADYVEVD